MKVASTLCKSFDVFADGELVYSTDKSHNSLCRIPLDVKASKLTVRFNETWGCDEVRLFSADVR